MTVEIADRNVYLEDLPELMIHSQEISALAEKLFQTNDTVFVTQNRMKKRCLHSKKQQTFPKCIARIYPNLFKIIATVCILC